MNSPALPIGNTSSGAFPASSASRKQRNRRWYQHLGHDFRIVARDTSRFLNQHRWTLLSVLAGLLTLCVFVINPHDASLLKSLRGSQTPFMKQLSGEIGYWGDFAQYNLGLAVLIWAFGYFRRSRTVQRLAVATMLAATLAGVTCNIFRFTLGRPRPHAEMQDGFYGIDVIPRGASYQSFPSGHTSTAFGTSTPLLISGGTPLGITATAFSSSVAWARMYRNKHYPTDVIIGIYLGFVFGLASSARLRQLIVRGRRKQKIALAIDAV